MHKIAGCVVSNLHCWRSKFTTRVLVRPEDIPNRPEAAEICDSGSDIEAAVEDGSSINELPQSMRQTSVPVDGHDRKARKSPRDPTSPRDDLRATRHQILQSAPAADYAISLDVMLLIPWHACYRGKWPATTPHVPSGQFLASATQQARRTACETIAARMLETLREGAEPSMGPSGRTARLHQF